MRPDRQTLLFSATFARRVEKLARDALRDPIRILHGDAGEASADVYQSVVYVVFKNFCISYHSCYHILFSF